MAAARQQQSWLALVQQHECLYFYYLLSIQSFALFHFSFFHHLPRMVLLFHRTRTCVTYDDNRVRGERLHKRSIVISSDNSKRAEEKKFLSQGRIGAGEHSRAFRNYEMCCGRIGDFFSRIWEVRGLLLWRSIIFLVLYFSVKWNFFFNSFELYLTFLFQLFSVVQRKHYNEDLKRRWKKKFFSFLLSRRNPAIRIIAAYGNAKRRQESRQN